MKSREKTLAFQQWNQGKPTQKQLYEAEDHYLHKERYMLREWRLYTCETTLYTLDGTSLPILRERKFRVTKPDYKLFRKKYITKFPLQFPSEVQTVSVSKERTRDTIIRGGATDAWMAASGWPWKQRASTDSENATHSFLPYTKRHRGHKAGQHLHWGSLYSSR